MAGEASGSASASVAHLVTLVTSGIFTIFGILIGAWLSRRSELMRLRVERRTQIFDEACVLTAEYYVRAYSSLTIGLTSNIDDSFMVSAMSLDRKIFTHFSRDAYTAWREVEQMIARKPKPTGTATGFTNARASALSSLAKELR
jgi:hypothetical protein